MSASIIVVVGAIILALAFDLINGFHDSANSIATVVSTRVLSPRFAVLWAAFFNFIAMFIFAPKVADTISKIVQITSTDPAFVYVVLSALVGAVIWDLLTWWLGLPTSSSHALVGGLAGAGMAYKGVHVIRWEMLNETVAFIPLAPVIGLVIGFVLMMIVLWMFRRWSAKSVDKLFRKGQLFSAAMYSLGHGGNDAQKTMGIIVALLVAAGIFSPDTKLSLMDWKTSWIILSCQLAMAIGTAFGGWRIVKTMGMRITKLKPVHGFAAETGGALTLFFATHLGIPVSTTHTISGSIVGVGATSRLTGIKWGITFRIIASWLITIPFAGVVSALCFWGIKLVHGAF
jgi:PiT family inorganic phosphate transporter